MAKELIVAPTAEALQALSNSFPVEQGFTRIMLPRLTFKSQNVTEGKGKNMVVTIEAGSFLVERETDETNDEGKKVWSKDDIGTSIEGTVVYQRKQLRYFDETTEEFTSSPIYDNDDEIVPLFCNKVEKHRGTPAELKALYQYTGKDGKVKTNLEDNRILFILKDAELFQLNLRGSSMYAFMKFCREMKSTPIPGLMLKFESQPMEKGSIEWNQMTFTPVRTLSGEEVATILNHIAEIRQSITDEKAYFANQNATPTAVLPAKDDF
jgi:hypothetical protein